ncbi:MULTISPECIES: hypothetical protein [unclassified Streptomyces]|uniref:hypothetical protein n=1 Tax=unclassified Streptomyces TaxID=2593676 RepID=UPI00278BFEE3|nr:MULTISPECIES: hypothetical protein [unclassified Streptomyces]
MSWKNFGRALRGLACALLGVQLWLLWYTSTYDASTVTWVCDIEGCASDQFASGAGVLGLGAGVLFGLVSGRALRRATAGVSVALGAVAALVGCYRALADGRVERSTDMGVLFSAFVRFPVSTWLTVLWILAGAGLVAALWGGWFSLRRTAGLRRLSPRYATAEAELRGWSSVGGGRGEVTAVFRDAKGVRHEVPTVVDRIALTRPVLAAYDRARPGDAARLRVVVPRRKGPRLR